LQRQAYAVSLGHRRHHGQRLRQRQRPYDVDRLAIVDQLLQHRRNLRGPAMQQHGHAGGASVRQITQQRPPPPLLPGFLPTHVDQQTGDHLHLVGE
jgi:hypothetical protein